jgi:hypothetical protein
MPMSQPEHESIHSRSHTTPQGRVPSTRCLDRFSKVGVPAGSPILSAGEPEARALLEPVEEGEKRRVGEPGAYSAPSPRESEGRRSALEGVDDPIRSSDAVRLLRWHPRWSRKDRLEDSPEGRR